MSRHPKKQCKKTSPAGNRTRVFRVTGGDTYHYTTEEHSLPPAKILHPIMISMPCHPKRMQKDLPSRESNPGLPRDRRRYLPLYYYTTEEHSLPPAKILHPIMISMPRHPKRMQKDLPGRESNPGLPRDRRRYLPLYYRGTDTTYR